MVVNNSIMNNNIVFDSWLSPDEKYCIFLDELYDIKNKKKLGDVWENIENLKFFVRYSTSVSDLKQNIKESIYESLNKSLILESYEKEVLKNNVKILMSEGWWDSLKGAASKAVEWAKGAGSKAMEYVKSAASWLGKGMLYLGRKLRDALYHPVGLILDAILVATGVGKAIQWIPWAIALAVDLYELFSNDYEHPMWMQLLFTLFDAIALVTTGAVAKGLKITFKGITKIDDVAKIASTNPNVKKIFQKVPEYLSGISPKLEQAIKYLSQKFPKGANFIKKVLGGVDKFISKLMESFGNLFSKEGVKAGVTAGAVVGGFHLAAPAVGRLFQNLFGGGEEGSVELSQEDIDMISNMDIDFEDI
jgi:hypothetical protein